MYRPVGAAGRAAMWRVRAETHLRTLEPVFPARTAVLPVVFTLCRVAFSCKPPRFATKMRLTQGENASTIRHRLAVNTGSKTKGVPVPLPKHCANELLPIFLRGQPAVKLFNATAKSGNGCRRGPVAGQRRQGRRRKASLHPFSHYRPLVIIACRANRVKRGVGRGNGTFVKRLTHQQKGGT